MKPKQLEVISPAGATLHLFYWSPPNSDVTSSSDLPAILLIHGLASNARMWDGVAVNMCHQGYQVACVDLRGHGRSSKPDDGYDFATISVDLDYVLQDLTKNFSPNWAKPLIAGQSWGGNVVLDFAASRPWSLRGAILVDGGILQLSDQFPEWERCAELLAPPVFEQLLPEVLEERIRQTHPDWPETGIQGLLANFIVTAQGFVAPNLTFTRHMIILQHLWRHKPSELYSKITAPTLILTARSANSAGNPSDKDGQIALAKKCIPKCEAEWLESDHDIHAQHPDILSSVIIGRDIAGFFS